MASDYVSLAVFKDEIRDTSTERDALYSRKITIASRVVDRLCGAVPGEFAAQTLTRYFDVPEDVRAGLYGSSRVELDMPIVSVTTLKTDEDGDGTFEVTWSALTDYILYPLNGNPSGTYDEIHVNIELGNYTFPTGQRRVEVAGVWGDSTAVPYPIQQATLLLANRYAKRPGTPYGIDKTAERMISLKSDPDVLMILEDGGYIKRAVFA